MPRYIQLSDETVSILKGLGRSTYFFDRLTKGNQLLVPESLYRDLQRRTPLGQSIDSTIRLLVKGTTNK